MAGRDAAAAAHLQRGGRRRAAVAARPGRGRAVLRGAAHGWTDAEARARPGGTTVDVQRGRQQLTLSLTQPGRTGAGGIWVVTAEADPG